MSLDEDRAAELAAIDASKPADPPPAPPASAPDYAHLTGEREYEPHTVYAWVWSERLSEWLYGYVRRWQQDEHGWWASVIVNKYGEGYLIVHETWTAPVPAASANP